MRDLLVRKGLHSSEETVVREFGFRKAPTHSSVEAQRRLAYFDERRAEIVSTIRELVEIESPATTKPPWTALRRRSRINFPSSVAKYVSTARQDFGSHLQVNFGGKSAKPVLLLLGQL